MRLNITANNNDTGAAKHAYARHIFLLLLVRHSHRCNRGSMPEALCDDDAEWMLASRPVATSEIMAGGVSPYQEVHPGPLLFEAVLFSATSAHQYVPTERKVHFLCIWSTSTLSLMGSVPALFKDRPA